MAKKASLESIKAEVAVWPARSRAELENGDAFFTEAAKQLLKFHGRTSSTTAKSGAKIRPRASAITSSCCARKSPVAD